MSQLKTQMLMFLLKLERVKKLSPSEIGRSESAATHLARVEVEKNTKTAACEAAAERSNRSVHANTDGKVAISYSKSFKRDQHQG